MKRTNVTSNSSIYIIVECNNNNNNRFQIIKGLNYRELTVVYNFEQAILHFFSLFLQ